MNELFTIGDFCFRLVCDEGITPPENFLKFRGGNQEAYTYTVRLVDALPEAQEAVIARRPDILVSRAPGGECRHIGTRGPQGPYACYQETDSGKAEIFVAGNQAGDLSIDPVFSSLFALERRQLDYGALILHCAYMELEGEAILFSAPSETGKTTQANLWGKYRGTRTVNGDRALIQKKDGRWIARGWPVCGSSGVCHNRDLPIRAVVMLSQAPEDRAERLAPMKAFTQIYSQITVNRWNKDANIRTMELLEQLIGEVPVYHLACTMNETAVAELERILMEDRPAF